MDKLLGKRPEVMPVATCSSRTVELPPVLKEKEVNARKRKTKSDVEEEIERCHQERMANQNRFLDLMEKLVNKM